MSELVSLVQLVGCLLADWAIVVHCLARQETFLLSKATRQVVGPTPPQNPWEPTTSRKWLGHETGHTPPSGAKVRNVWSYTAIASYTQRQGLLVLARIFIVEVTENHSMLLLFIHNSQVCALPVMMLLNLGFVMWMVNGPAVFESSVWGLVANPVLCS